jgi:cytochrome c oxidase cbb3-type subunit 3
MAGLLFGIAVTGCENAKRGVGADVSTAGQPLDASASHQSDGAASHAGLTEEEQKIESGKASYVRYCTLCHGEDAVGYAADHANQLRNPAFLASASDHFLHFAIRYGRPGTPMGAFWNKLGGPLDEEGVSNLILYLRSLSQVDTSDTVVSGDIRRGGALFNTHCKACHGDQGQGGSAPSLSNPNFLATATDGFLRYAIEYGRPQTPMMPYAGRLDAQQIGDLTRYIRSWARNVDYASPVGEVVPKLTDLILNPAGAPPQFRLRTERYVDLDQVAHALKSHERIVLLDARVKSDWIASHIPGAYPAPFYDTVDAELLKALPREGTWIIIYCSCPHAASNKLMDALRELGFGRTAVIDEGFLEWTRRKYPTTFGRNE